MVKRALMLSLLIVSFGAAAQSREESARAVMVNARALCSFAEAGVGLTVTCPRSLERTSRLGFATAIANADAVLSVRARPIDFRLQGGERFAEASPQTGIGEIASAKSSKGASKTSSAITVGTLADTVLARRGKATSVKQVGRDENGLLVEWQYPDETYLMARRIQGGIEAYRVIKITRRK